MSTLLAGPDYALEFGWLVMAWVPYVRYMAQKYDEVIILCNAGNQYLYEDFAKKFYTNSFVKGDKDRWLIDEKKAKMPLIFRSKFPDADVVVPSRETCMSGKSKWHKYGQDCFIYDRCNYDIVIHARAVTARESGDRNWPVQNYIELLRKLNKDRDITVASIGKSPGAYHIPGTEDRRNIPLIDLCNLLASSKLLIGPSSGPMHLGELCGIPRIVWTYDKKLKILGYRTNKWRYKKYWRPFNTPVKVIEWPTWRLPVKVVYKKVLKALV